MMLFMIMIMIIVNTWQVRRSSTSAFLIQVYETIRQDIAKDKVRRQQMENAMDIPVTDTPSAGASVTGIDVDTILTGESSDEWSSVDVDVAVRDRPNKTTTTRKQQSAAAESKWSDSSDSDSSTNPSKMSINKLSNSASTRTHSTATATVGTVTMTRTTPSGKQQKPAPAVDDDDIDIFNPFTVDDEN